MTAKDDRARLLAALLIGLGLLFLAINLGWFAWLAGWIWPLLFVAGGGTFLYLFLQDRARWWALIPGFALVAIGLASLAGGAAGTLFLGLLGAGFVAIYATDRSRWWAILPAGILLTLALVAWIDVLRPGFDGGWLFFLGVAITFAMLLFLPAAGTEQRWAIYPALGCLAMSVITLAVSVGGTVMALLLIGAGLVLIWRRQGSKDEPNVSGPPRAPKPT